MIMLRLTRAITASWVALAVIQATGCGSDGAAENKGAARLAATPSTPSDAASAENSPEPGSHSVAMAVEAGVERMMHPTLVELHHFNAYKNFLALLDAASDVHGNDKNRGDSGTRSAARSSGDSGYVVCSGNSLIKQGD